MIVGVGNDIVEIKRFNQVNERFSDRVLTEFEKRTALSNQYLAGRFSSKEAFFKALGTGIQSFQDLSIINSESGKPQIWFHKDFGNFNFAHISISHDKFAFTCIILERLEGFVFLGLGSNLGDRKENIKTALGLIEKEEKVLKVSKIYETEPYGKTDQPNFLNCVVEISTEKSPTELLKRLLEIEKVLGRVRTEKWGPRTIDIDILFYGNLYFYTNDLKLPHYDFENRSFFTEPLKEISKEFYNIRPVFRDIKGV